MRQRLNADQTAAAQSRGPTVGGGAEPSCLSAIRNPITRKLIILFWMGKDRIFWKRAAKAEHLRSSWIKLSFSFIICYWHSKEYFKKIQKLQNTELQETRQMDNSVPKRKKIIFGTAWKLNPDRQAVMQTLTVRKHQKGHSMVCNVLNEQTLFIHLAQSNLWILCLVCEYNVEKWQYKVSAD